MDPLLTGWIAPILGIAAAIISGIFATRARTSEHRLQRQREADEHFRNVVLQAREPLLYAASDLQSRIYNIVNGRFIQEYARSEHKRHRVNVSEYTAFLFAQYFGWAEAMRQAVLLSEMAGVEGAPPENIDQRPGTVAAVMREISDTLRTDAYGSEFMLFAAEQHAIGELMFSWDNTPGGRTPSVSRYASFAKRFRDETHAGQEFRTWLEAINEGMELLDSEPVRERLSQVQNHLVDLMNLLDPDNRLYKARNKLPVA